MKKLRFFLYLDFSNQIENFLFASVTTIICIRGFLYLTGYPQLGGSGGLHIAHMLWGGLFMLLSSIIFLAFVSEKSRNWASVLSGIGFGFFIDELGKFLTADNNYFFKPTFVILYGIFIAIFFGAKFIESHRRRDDKELSLNVIELYKLTYTGDFDAKDKERLNQILSSIKTKDPVMKAIAEVHQRVNLDSEDRNIIIKIKQIVYKRYEKLVKNPRFQSIIIALFSVVTVLSFIGTSFQLVVGSDQTLYLFSRLATALCVIVGIFFIQLKKNRLRGFTWFKYAIFISIFISQFFLFYDNQAAAIVNFIVYLTLYFIIRALIYQENALSNK